MKTRLEIYELPAIAVGGPTEALDSEATLPNLQGKWPVSLLRLFMPNPYDLQGKAADIKSNVLSWWAQLSIDRIRACNVAYDATEGISGYGVGLFGGSLDINAFYDKVNPTINSFDMGALLEAAYHIILPTFAVTVTPKITWVGLTPAGSIANKDTFPMVPLGWEADAAAATGVSTPFFKGIGSKCHSSDCW